MMYRTFSNEFYLYQSTCEYVLVGAKNGKFLVTIQNQPCSTSDRACFKNLRIQLKRSDGSTMKINLLAGIDMTVDGVHQDNYKYADKYLESRPIGALWVVLYFPTIKMTITFDFSKSHFNYIVDHSMLCILVALDQSTYVVSFEDLLCFLRLLSLLLLW